MQTNPARTGTRAWQLMERVLPAHSGGLPRCYARPGMNGTMPDWNLPGKAMADDRAADEVKGNGALPRRWVSLATSLAFLVPLLLYLPTLQYGFIYDDVPLVARNEAIRSLSAALGYFQHDFDAYTRGWEGTQSNYYRPVTFLFMALLQPWAGVDPSRWHAVVIVLNALVGALAFRVLLAHQLSLMRALFGALLFSLHPLHVHSAAWVTGLHDGLAAVFVLTGYWALVRWLDRGSTATGLRPYAALVGFAVCLTLAVLSKESSLALAPLGLGLALLSAWQHPELRRPAAAAAAVAVSIAAAYLVVRVQVLGVLAQPFPTAPDWPRALASLAPLAWAYLKAWAFLVDLSLFSPFRPVVSLSGAGLWLAWAGAVLLTGAALVLACRRRAWAYPLLFGVCMLAPHLNVRALNPEWVLMHRYLYLPGLALAWMVALLPVPGRLRRPAWGLGGALLVLLALGSLQDMRAYRDEATFWAKAVDKDPASSTAWAEQGRLLQERGNMDGARTALQRAVELDPGYLLPRLRLGNLAFSQRDYVGAADHYRAVTVRRPDYPPAWRNLPKALLAAGQRGAALEAAQEAFRRFPGDAEVLVAVGTVRKLGGDLPGAVQAFRVLVTVRPGDATAWLRLASLQAEAGAVDDALQSLSHLTGLTQEAAVLEAAEQLRRSLRRH